MQKGQTYKIQMQGDVASLGIKAGEVFYIYSPHWVIPEVLGLIKKPLAMDSVFISGVPFYAQNDTSDQGFRECNAHSCAMLCAYLLGDEYQDFLVNPRYRSQPELVYIDRMRKYGDTTDHIVQTVTLKTFGIESYWSDRVSPEILHGSLNQNIAIGNRLIKGIPVVAGVSYKVSGHILLIKGHKGNRYTVNDPNGIRSGLEDVYYQKSTNINKVGENDILSTEFMRQKFFDLGINNGYARIVTQVKGIRTNLS